jgi:hypothetical protein
MYTLLDVLKKLNTYKDCIYRTCFGCLLLEGCKCDKKNTYGGWEDFSKDH